MTNFDLVKRGGGGRVGKWPPRKIFAKDAPFPIKSQGWGAKFGPLSWISKLPKKRTTKGVGKKPP